MHILVNAENVSDVAKACEVNRSLPIICSHKVKKHKVIFNKVRNVFRNSPHYLINDFILHALRHNAVSDDLLFVNGELQFS